MKLVFILREVFNVSNRTITWYFKILCKDYLTAKLSFECKNYYVIT